MATLTIFDITGASLSGIDGAANRTYTLPYSDVSNVGMIIWVNGVVLHYTQDYTLTSSVITFLDAINNTDNIEGEYYYNTSATINTVYATKTQLIQFMGLYETIPNNTTTTRENVGTGDNSNLRFWLDHRGVIDGTLILSYGTSEASLTVLTFTTHYTIDSESSLITLTTTGRTALSTNNLYAAYTYNILELSDTQIGNAITRAEQEIDNFTNNHFTDGTSATPDWNQYNDEEQDGKGIYDRNYFTLQHYPIPTVNTLVNGAITANDVTITVDSTNGFPSSGYILIGTDKITYTGKTTTQFTGCTSVEAHDDNFTVKPYVIEISTTDPGGTISWDVLEEGIDFELDKRTGRIHLYSAGGYYFGQYYDEFNSPPKGVANRFRISYISGYSSIPDDIVKVTCMIASKDLMSMAVRKAHAQGMNDFNPETIDVDKEEIEKILSHYKNEQYMRC